MNAAFKAIVRGGVQGVGFRWFVQGEADRLGLVGGVRNLRDGTLEVIAEGSQDRLVQLGRSLRKGPMGSNVADVEVHWEGPSGQYREFEIWSSR